MWAKGFIIFIKVFFISACYRLSLYLIYGPNQIFLLFILCFQRDLCLTLVWSDRALNLTRMCKRTMCHTICSNTL